MHPHHLPRRTASTVFLLLLLFATGAATGLTWNRTECHAPNDRQFLRVLYSATGDAAVREQAIGQAGAMATQIVEAMIAESRSSNPQLAAYATARLARIVSTIQGR